MFPGTPALGRLQLLRTSVGRFPVRPICSSSSSSTVDPSEISKFAAQAALWWHPEGPAAPLHRMNPTRVGYIRSVVERFVSPNRTQPDPDDSGKPLHPLRGIEVLDVGCAGGLVSEPIARLGATVKGIDKSTEGIAVARHHLSTDHMLSSSNRITYEEYAVEDIASVFDVVLALEIIEHVSSPDIFLRHCASRVRPGGALVLSTMNRTALSYALGIVAAERILGWLPRGTHDWTKFPTPEEVADVLERQTGMKTVEVRGVRFNPLTGGFYLHDDTSVNYILAAVKEPEETPAEEG